VNEADAWLLLDFAGLQIPLAELRAQNFDLMTDAKQV